MSVAADRTRLRRSLERLDPASRALLELSMGRGLADEEIAEVLGSDADAVARRRTEVLESVAADSECHGETRPLRRTRNDVRELLSGKRSPAGHRGRRRAAVGASLLAAVAAMGALGAAGGDDPNAPAPPRGAETSRPGPPVVLGAGASKPRAEREAAPPSTRRAGGGEEARWTFRGAAVALTASEDSRTEDSRRPRPQGAVRLLSRGEDSRALELSLRGLPRPRGRYVLRLYNTSADAVSLASFPVAPRKITIPLVDDPGSYRFVGLASERGGDAPRRPPRSILRAPIADLVATP